MQGYVVSRPVTIRSANQVKHVGASANLGQPAVGEVQINALNEARLVHDQLRHEFPDVPIGTLFKGVPHERLAQWSQFPMVLGRFNSPIEEDAQVLTAQLKLLRERHPLRRHFRMLINNGFGSNLGDTMMGITAFRSVWPILKTQLAEVSVDVLLGWLPGGAVTRMLQQCEGLECVLHQGPSLQALSRYQGIFDTSGLITLPRYGTMPAVDWILWWMGLDPQQVDKREKRNRMALDPGDTAAVSERLAPATGPRILLNPMATEPLRRMPAATARTIAQAVLKADLTAWVVFDQPVDFEHPRALHLADLINSPERLAALVAQVDGVITPDTFLQHVADAADTPACTLSASIPAEFYRYYPLASPWCSPAPKGSRAGARRK